MGTYTANKNLYMPSVGEQGWGDLMNTNLSTIDNFLKPITESGGTYTFTGNHVGNQSGGSISATSISNSGTLTNTGTSTFTGKITANGGIGTKALTATSISNSGTLTQTGTSTFTGKITANGGVNDYEERITALESGEFNGEVSAETFNGALRVIPTFADTGIGSYDVTLNSMTESASGSNASGSTSTLTTNTITVSNVSVIKKQGFDFDLVPLKVSGTLSMSCSIGTGTSSSKMIVYLYHNKTLVTSKTVSGEVSMSISMPFDLYVSKGDTFYAKGTFYDKWNGRNQTLTLKFSTVSGNLYVG